MIQAPNLVYFTTYFKKRSEKVCFPSWFRGNEDNLDQIRRTIYAQWQFSKNWKKNFLIFLQNVAIYLYNWKTVEKSFKQFTYFCFVFLMTLFKSFLFQMNAERHELEQTVQLIFFFSGLWNIWHIIKLFSTNDDQ